MALTACRECGKQISDMAAACPHCGAPTIATARDGSTGGIVTTQQTSKTFKKVQLLGAAMMCVGVVACTGSEAEGKALSSLLTLGGLFVFLGARIGAWWRNG